MRNTGKWTEDEIAIAAKIYAEHPKTVTGYFHDGRPRYWGQAEIFRKIADAIHRPVDGVDSRFRTRGPNFTGPQLSKYRQNQKNWYVPSSGRKKAFGADQASTFIKPPDHVLAERERRYNLEPRDLTAVLMGDPLPTCSALDMK
jgi:hypothetical protein